LAEGTRLAQAGQRAQAYDVLLGVVELDQRNEQAWLWLSTLTDDVEDQRICLENALTLNPNNTAARQRLAALPANGAQAPSTVICPQCGAGNRDFVRECRACGYALFLGCYACGELNPSDALTCSRCGTMLPLVGSPAAKPGQAAAGTSAVPQAATEGRPAAPATLWPVVAFWIGTSAFFAVGGLVSVLQFAGLLLRARGVIQNLSAIQAAWLPMGLFFVVFGYAGLNLAWQIAHRRPVGYYGSLIFGMFLTLLGPSASLVLEPPNYPATICLGLMPAAAVLLTLASLSGFESHTDAHDRSMA
jgi:ribosomal protein L40E